VNVYASSSESGASASATTGENGAYSITGLPAGSYTVEFEAPGQNYVSQYYPAAASPEAATPVKLSAGETKGAVGATLANGASISGIVDEAGGSRQPLTGINVYAYKSCSIGSVATTNSEGHYTVQGLPAGSYHVIFNPDGGGLNVDPYTGTIVLAKGAAQGDVNGSLTEEPEGESATPFACEESQGAAPPEFGRCLKVSPEVVGKKTVYRGGFTASTCLAASGTHTGKYEWTPGVAKQKLTASVTTAKFETAAKTKIECKAASGTGEYSGTKALGGFTIRFTGCTGFDASCSSAGAAAGEIVTGSLAGSLGWQEKAKRKVALDFAAASTFASFACGTTSVVWRGSLIAPPPPTRWQRAPA
jgi:hypothetical protein